MERVHRAVHPAAHAIDSEVGRITCTRIDALQDRHRAARLCPAGPEERVQGARATDLFQKLLEADRGRSDEPLAAHPRRFGGPPSSNSASRRTMYRGPGEEQRPTGCRAAPRTRPSGAGPGASRRSRSSAFARCMRIRSGPDAAPPPSACPGVRTPARAPRRPRRSRNRPRPGPARGTGGGRARRTENARTRPPCPTGLGQGGRPQRSLPLRQRQEVQEVPRRGVTAARGRVAPQGLQARLRVRRDRCPRTCVSAGERPRSHAMNPIDSRSSTPARAPAGPRAGPVAPRVKGAAAPPLAAGSTGPCAHPQRPQPRPGPRPALPLLRSLLALGPDLGVTLVGDALDPKLAVPRHGRCQRLFGRGLPPSGGERRRVLIHGVSVGEVKVAMPLVRALEEHHPEIEVVICATTDTGLEVARRHCTRVTAHRALSGGCVTRSRLAACSRRIRPGLRRVGGARGVAQLPALPATAAASPVAVVNGRITGRQLRAATRLFRNLLPQFSRISLICVQDEEYARASASSRTRAPARAGHRQHQGRPVCRWDQRRSGEELRAQFWAPAVVPASSSPAAPTSPRRSS